MWNGVGGSTNVYGAIWPRYRPSDFRKGTEHGLQPDWPITYEDLAPFYERAGPPGRRQRACRRSGHAAASRLSDAAAAGAAAARRLAGAFDRLGWHWWPVPAGVISRGL